MTDANGETDAGKKIDSSERSTLAKAELVVGMIKTITVPLILLFLTINFYRPLSDIMIMLPEKFRDADKVSAGGLSFEIQQRADASGNPRLARLIGGLSEAALRYLLNSSSNRTGMLSYSSGESAERYYYYPEKGKMAAMKELEAKKLLSCDTSLAQWEKDFTRLMAPSSDGFSQTFRPKRGNESLISGPASPLNVSCGLTSTGTAAVDVIIETVTSQISRKSPDPRVSESERVDNSTSSRD